ncbi:uncharacterized protein LOC113147291 [Cyclospora cayetanensis]|uniref:Uncharacterized protein LOC113147291 n=1 Tax=Cyclospora cayetanensis TaxID=88456 RepID=A0A6P6S0J9_9EIME|nr:uncharacterized protein LOC113147291 [Cyclospora cayetanensis]
MPSPQPPELRTLNGQKISSETLRLPKWTWPYFRAGGAYTQWPLPVSDYSGGRTRVADSAAGGAALNGGENCGGDTKAEERNDLQHFSADSASLVSTATGPEDGVYRHLLHDMLLQPGAVEELLYFVSECKCHLVVICSVGRLVCGHKGIVHGGFTATLLDNSLGVLGHAQYNRAATKNLSVKYLRPFVADSTVLLDAYIKDINPHVCTIAGTLLGPIPPQFASNFPPQQQQQQQQQEKQNGLETLPPRDEGLWVVAAVSGEMVDVTRQWKGL